MIAYIARENRVVAIDFDSRAPLAYRDELYANPDDRRYSWRAITVPGVVAGLDLALQTFGTTSWKDVAARALKLAEEGVPVENKIRRQLEDWRERTDDESLGALFASKELPNTKDLWVQREHAAVLRRIVEEGPDLMYRGEIGRQIVRQVQAHGGVLSIEDFAAYQATLEQPLRVSYRGHDLFTPPPPSGGMTSLQILKTLEQLDLPPDARWQRDHIHALAEAIKY